MRSLFSFLVVFLLCYSNGRGDEKLIRMNVGKTQDVLQLAKTFLPKDPIVIEAGGYTGDDSVQIALLWPKGRLFSFEPVPELFDHMQKKVQGFSNITCFQKALSDQNGYATFYLSEWRGRIAGSSSLLPPKEHLTYDPDVSFPTTLEVEAVTLDDFAKQQGIERVDFLWLDMQGFELNTIKASTLALSAKVIYTEVEFVEAYAGQYLYEDVKSWMSAHGFRLVATDFDESRIPIDLKTNKAYCGNALFVKNN